MVTIPSYVIAISAQLSKTLDHGSYSYTPQQTQMTTFSIITTHDSAFVPVSPLPDFEALKDMHGLPWEPSPPPANYTETTPSYHGTSAHGKCATFLDFSRRVANITGLLAAGPDTKTEMLGGFSIIYADGGVVYCGATTAVQDLHDTQPGGSSIGGLIANQKALEALEIPHVSSEESARAQPTDLEVCGETIRQVNVWAAAYLHGIQFVTQSGRESPKWGKCGGPASVVVVAGSLVEKAVQAGEVSDGEDMGEKKRVVGLKIVLGSRRYNRGYADVRPLAVQIMGA